MTPTLAGRWQTRIAVLTLAGVPICLVYGWLAGDQQTPLALLGYVAALGVLWDVAYQWVQSFRWDQDWPPLFQLGAGVLEGITVWLLIGAEPLWDALGLPDAPGVRRHSSWFFAVHYALVWSAAFVWTQSVLRVLFPRWRFSGGRLL